MTPATEKDGVSAIVEWWLALHPKDNGPNDNGPSDNGRDGDRAARAQLRRADSVLAALVLPQTQFLLQKAHQNGLPRSKDDAVILLAIVLAHAKPGHPDRLFAQALGQTKDDVSPNGEEGRQRLSSLRFGALMQTMDGDDIHAKIRALRRSMLVLKDRSFNMKAFIGDILYFNDQTKRNWTYQYWQTWRTPETPALTTQA